MAVAQASSSSLGYLHTGVGVSAEKESTSLNDPIVACLHLKWMPLHRQMLHQISQQWKVSSCFVASNNKISKQMNNGRVDET